MHYTHNSHKRREAQAQFIERFLPQGERVPKRLPGPYSRIETDREVVWYYRLTSSVGA